MDLDAIKKSAAGKSKAALYRALRGAYRASGRARLRLRPSPAIEPVDAADWQTESGKRYSAGFGKATLLPDDFMQKTYYVAGYGENNPATGYLDEPHVHALWLDDNSGRGALLLVSSDTVGLLNADVEEIRADLADFAQTAHCRGIHIMSTHDHASIDTMGNWGPLPRSGRDKAYMAFFRAQVKKAAIAAYRDRRDGDLYMGEIEVPDMQEDIRTPYVYSKTLTRLRFVPRDGTRETWLVHFASHSESLQGCNSRVSADFPGYLREAIRTQTGAETLYLVGAIGGMISMQIEDEQQIRDAGGDFAASTRRIGTRLAGYALRVEKEKKLKPCVNQLRQTFYVEADNTMLLAAKTAHILRAKAESLAGSPLGLALRTEMTYLEIGQMHLLLAPGELFPELVYGGYLDAAESASGCGGEINPEPLTQIAGDPALRIVGLANDELGYILPKNDFLLHDETPYFAAARDRHGRRHYEETNSLGPKTAETLANVFREMMQTVRNARGC